MFAISYWWSPAEQWRRYECVFETEDAAQTRLETLQYFWPHMAFLLRSDSLT